MTGLVEALWRYPVKSMLGEPQSRVTLDEKGVAGDRAWALIDQETKRVVSAKNPRLWPSMFRFSAASLPEGVRITCPDGTTVDSHDEHADRILTKAIGRPVHLSDTPPDAPASDFLWRGMSGADGGLAGEELDEEGSYRLATRAPGTFFDSSPVHILTTATLRSLEAVEPGASIDPRRFRPNLLLQSTGDGYPENGWLGKMLAIGEVVLEITRPTSRCVMTTLAQGDLPRDPRVLRATAKGNRIVKDPGAAPDPCAGVYALVRNPGVVTRGDGFRIA